MNSFLGYAAIVLRHSGSERYNPALDLRPINPGVP